MTQSDKNHSEDAASANGEAGRSGDERSSEAKTASDLTPVDIFRDCIRPSFYQSNSTFPVVTQRLT